MKPALLLTAAALFLAACQPADDTPPAEAAPAPQIDTAPATPENAPVSLTEKWVATGFSAPEGVAAAPGGGYFISNVAGNGGEKDGSGWVSKLSGDGEIEAEQFAIGMDAPKGMAVDRGILYVADLDRIHLVDPDDGTLLRTLTIEGAEGLNDMTVWNASVLVADSQTGRIYRLSGDEADIWLEDERLAGVSGLTSNGDRLLIATMESGSLYEITEAKTLNEIATGMKNADGIGVLESGYLVSSWPGQVWHVSKDGKTTEILNTQANGILQNDLTLIGDTLIIPNWMPGTVTAWTVEAR